ncbi:MAG: hypothetical protein HC831_12940 [Chloroflexia bacterium]|nr:hypothetical protein [Chloroflexia bacterium]
MLQAIIINGITNQYNLLGFRSYLPGTFFILITANFPEYQIVHPVLIANLLFLLVWERMVSITEKSNSYKAFFNASFFLGLATLFYPNYLYLVIILVSGTVLNRISHPREFIMIIVGLLTIWYFYFAINYIMFSKLQLDGIHFRFEFVNEPFSTLRSGQLVLLSYVVVLMIVASFRLSAFVSNVKIQIRRNLKILFIWFVIGLVIFLATDASFEFIYTCSVSVAFLFAMFLSNLKNKWFPEIIWLLLFGLTIINQFFPHLI